ncbi:SLC35B3 [Symbiodinium necroappetens]|uniref:SLC35B3 protein n=1 Tax=Symbiodinium necroappetens TaxID=1628268 RepID=A0A812U3K5_9DINO|nr:SLC35B3 [Symbiodinium necroappetens]
MASKPNRRITKKTSPKKVAKAKKKDKSKKEGSNAKSAYHYFLTSQRKDVLSRADIEDTPLNFERSAKAVAAAWQGLSKIQREPFERCAALDRTRRDLGKMKGAKLKVSNELTGLVKAAVEALAQTPSADSCSAGRKAAEDVVASLEALDSRLCNAGRAAAAAGLRNGASGVMLAAGAVGPAVGGRLTAIIRKWSSAPAPKRKAPKQAQQPPPKSAASQASPGPGSGDGESTLEGDYLRSRVVGMLMRTAGQKLGKAHLETCRRIEASLYHKFGQNLKEYRQRARSLSVNLSKAENRLLEKVCEGSLQPSELAGLTGEDLAPEAVRIAREMERQRHFREEVHLTAAHPKTKHELFVRRRDSDERCLLLQGMNWMFLFTSSEPSPQAQVCEGAHSLPASLLAATSIELIRSSRFIALLASSACR